MVVFCELSLTVAVFPKLSSQIAMGIIGPLDKERPGGGTYLLEVILLTEIEYSYHNECLPKESDLQRTMDMVNGHSITYR